jgi:hypothetical protein
VGARIKHAGHTKPSITVSDGGAAGRDRWRPRPPLPKRDAAGTACGGGGRSGEPSFVPGASSVLGIGAASRSGETTVRMLEAGDVQSVWGRAVGHRFRSSGLRRPLFYCRVDGVNLFHHHRVRSVFVAMKRRGRVYTLYAVLLSVFWFGLPTLAPA